MKSRNLLPSTNCFFPVWWYVKPLRSCIDCELSFQNKLNVISLEREDFKFSIGSLKNKFPYMVLESLNILQSALCLRSRDFNIAVNVKEEN